MRGGVMYTVAAVAIGQLVIRQLLQSTTIPPGFTATTCSTGIYDCANPNLACNNGSIYYSGKAAVSSSTGLPKSCTNGCAPYTDPYTNPTSQLWVVIVGGIFAAGMAFLIGGNDASNSWATSVGSRAIPLKWALIVGAFFEWLGATTLGYGVSGAVTKGVSKTTNPKCWACGYCNSKMGVYAVTMLSALIAANIFLFLATFTAFPVSTTHSIIGGVVGGTIVAVGFGCLNWAWKGGLGGIIASWVLSPVCCGLIAIIIYVITSWLVINSPFPCGPAKTALICMPIHYGLGTFVIVSLVMLKANPTKKLSKGIQFGVGAAAGLLLAIVSLFTVVPLAKKQLRLQHDQIHLPGEVDPIQWPDGKNKVVAAAEAELAAVQDEAAVSEKAASNAEKVVVDAENPAPAGSTDAPEEQPVAAHQPHVKGTAEFFKDGVHILTSGNNEERTKDDTEKALTEKKGFMTTFKANYVDKYKRKTADDWDTKVQTDSRFHVKEEWTPEQKEAIWVYRYLLPFVAALEAFAHGSNDTANATGAFSAILTSYQDGLYVCSQGATQWYVMTIAGALVGLGVICFGYRVIRTMGEEITAINFHRGFCMEFASAITVTICTVLNLPVSTTHCQVGAVVFVGLFAFGWRHVDWGLFGKIILSWIATIPASGLLAAAFTAALRPAVSN